MTATQPIGILGAARTPVGKTPGIDSLTLHAQAAHAAITDAGIDPLAIDGIITFGSFTRDYVMHSAVVAEFLGLRRIRYADVVRIGGASAAGAVSRAVAAISAGRCDTVLIVSGDDQLSGLTRDLAVKGMAENRHYQYEAPYGVTTPAAFAMMARLYLQRHHLSEELLAHVTVQSRRTASKLPDAMYGKPCTVDEVNSSKPIADPLRMLHCAPIADGGGALVAGRGAPGEVVEVLGSGEAHSNAHLVFNPFDASSAAAASAGHAFQQAGVRPADLGAAQVYDCFASVVAQVLEEAGIAPAGRALYQFADGEYDVDGGLPVNLNGGLLSGGHPGMPGGLLHVVEAAEQVRGSARVPVAGGKPVFVHCLGGIMSNHATLILGGGS